MERNDRMAEIKVLAARIAVMASHLEMEGDLPTEKVDQLYTTLDATYCEVADLFGESRSRADIESDLDEVLYVLE